jgi:hypothetical protein
MGTCRYAICSQCWLHVYLHKLMANKCHICIYNTNVNVLVRLHERRQTDPFHIAFLGQDYCLLLLLLLYIAYYCLLPIFR